MIKSNFTHLLDDIKLTKDETNLLLQLTLGERFTTSGIEGVSRQLLYRQGRPVGHISTRWGGPKHVLWLQNYCGYGCHPRFCYEMQSLNMAIYQAIKMLLEWETNENRPTWIGAMEM
jgi:hypothetical protein